MLVTPAFAQAAAPAASPTGGLFEMLVPIAMIFVVFYFLLLRPQQKKQKEMRAMIDAVKRGDRVVTSGGILGTIVKVEEREVVLEIADNTRVKLLKAMIVDVVARTGGAEAKGDAKDAKKDDKKPAEPAEYYRALGVAPGATQAEIAAAYAQKPGDAAATEAYEVLKDPKLRKLYDRLGHDEFLSTTR
jgi:preprotein translocase subunit YajC